MIIFSLIVFFSVKISLFFYFLNPLCLFSGFWWLVCSLLFFISFIYFSFLIFCCCTGRTAHWGSRGIALPFHDHGTRRGWGVSVTPRPLFTPGKDPVPILQEAGWAPGPVWNISPPPGFDSRNVQPLANRYIDYATRPTLNLKGLVLNV